jgi:hypothetical protein
MGKVNSSRTARRQTANGRAGTPIEKLLAEARLKLIETGTRNRLIHTPRGAKRSRALAITGNAPDDVFANLVRGNKPLPVLAAEIADKQRDAATPETPRLVTRRTGDPNGLQTSLPPELLHKRLHAMHRDAKTAEEERGVNILFLALGFLRWYEDEKSDMARDAPLILLPVYLGRDHKRSNFDLKLREEDIATNRALHERLRGDFGLALPDVAETEDWLPSSYFDAVATAVAAKRRWSIDANAIELGFYSFAKQLMMRDLEPGNWPDNALFSHPLLRGLLGEGFAAEPPVAPEAVRLDEILNPADLIHVVDADSSQTRVIEAVRAGHISSSEVRLEPANRRRSRILSRRPCMTVKRFCSSPLKRPPSTLFTSGWTRWASTTSASNSTAGPQTSGNLPKVWIALCKRPPAHPRQTRRQNN